MTIASVRDCTAILLRMLSTCRPILALDKPKLPRDIPVIQSLLP